MATIVPFSRSAPTRRTVTLIGALLLAVTAALAFVLTAGAAPPAHPAQRGPALPARQGVTATAVLTGNAGLPVPVDTSRPALPVQTGQAAGPVGTSGPGGVGPGNTNTGGQPGQSGQPTLGSTPGSAADSNNSPPWLWIIAGLLLLGIAAGAAYMFTRRSAAPALAPAAAPPPPVMSSAPAAAARFAPAPADTAAVGTATVALADAPTAVVPVAAPVSAAAALAPLMTPPTMVKCPNCDTMNPIDRRYCDECGQDLRAAVAAAVAGTLPEVEVTTPYLETLSRADEQLEFVLARDLITVGRALDNDIVIDDQFIGWQTVSPRHAELRRSASGFTLRDLNSENGTFVNSSRTGENALDDGMTIAFGKVEFIYRVPTE